MVKIFNSFNLKINFILTVVFLMQFIFINKIFSSEITALRDFKFSLMNISTRDTISLIKTTGIKTKSVSKALFLSLFLPGLGERYVGKNKLSKYLIISEITLWSMYIYQRIYGGWIEEDYKLFSTAHAGVNIAGKDKKYFVNIGNFSDIFKYNNKKRLDRDEEFIYDNISDYYWRWDADENRQKFEDMRIESDKYINRLNYFIAGLFLNHIVSGINAAVSAKNLNKSIKILSNWKLEYRFCMPNDFKEPDMKITLKFQF